MSAERIITSYWAKPIPWRHYDWEATTDNYEAGHPIGFGATEADAIADLKEQLEELLPDDERVMPMLPNDYHPGPRCSCEECLRVHP